MNSKVAVMQCAAAGDDSGDSFLTRIKKTLSGSPGREGAASSQSEDKACIEKVLGGDREAYRQIVEKYQQRAFLIASSIVRSRADAEDIVQESFVKAYLSIREFRGDAAFYTWLYRIVYNMAVDFVRKVARRGTVSAGLAGDIFDETLGARIAGGVLPDQELLRREQGREIVRVLADLSDEHRAVIVLREVDGLSYEEIARVAGVSKGTVMSRLHYARKKLQLALAEYAPAGSARPAISDDVPEEQVSGETDEVTAEEHNEATLE